MPGAKETYTATLRELRPREIADRRSGHLEVRIRSGSEQRDVAVDAQRITIGSHEDNDIVISGDGVSGVHCELRMGDDHVTLRDLDSKNGTWIGDVRIREAVIPRGGSFVIGGSTLTVREVARMDVPVSLEGRFGELVGRGSRMGALFSQLERLAAMEIDVLVVGETGTGKELVARGLHSQSDRRDGPFEVVDCTTLNEGIAESLLFGHRKGAFTGADADQAGFIEASHGGTLFLDEVGELPLPLQAKLLRALEQRQTRRVGETAFRPFDARVVAATNRDLLKMVGEGSFRQDLYFRLGQVTLEVPPLRERGRADAILLADLFLGRFAEQRGRTLRFDATAHEVLVSASWPGNVRQLKNAVKHAAAFAEGEVVRVEHLPALSRARGSKAGILADGGVPMEEVAKALRMPWVAARRAWEHLYVTALMERTDGNQSEAARLADVARSSLREMVKRTTEAAAGPNHEG